jgi:hypothetical protein
MQHRIHIAVCRSCCMNTCALAQPQAHSYSHHLHALVVSDMSVMAVDKQCFWTSVGQQDTVICASK